MSLYGASYTSSRYSIRYSKATKNWKAQPIKEAKTYAYMPQLLLDIIDYREVSRKFQRLDSPTPKDRNDPTRHRPTIAAIPKPDKKKLIEERKKHSSCTGNSNLG